MADPNSDDEPDPSVNQGTSGGQTESMSTAASWWRRSEVAIAAIAASAGLLGAGLGAFVTYESNKYSQDRADQRVAATNASLARGAARVLQSDYGNAVAVIDVMLRSNRYFLVPELAGGLSYDDKKQLAAAVSPQTWATIANADGDLESLVQLVQARPELRVTPLSAADRKNLEENRAAVVSAGDALTPITQVQR